MNAITLRGLLQRQDLSLQLVSAITDDGSGALDHPIRWGYSTDLLDPTPFLRGSELILTTGQQLLSASDVKTVTRDYVERIARGGAVGLVYTLEHPDPRWEAVLRRSCVAAGMPLLEAPFSTPFISISEAISSGRADPERESLRKVLHAQHALTLASLERMPAQALVRELALLLGCSVWLWGGGARLLGVAPVDPPPSWVEPLVRDRMHDARRRRQSGREEHDGQHLIIHMLNAPESTAPIGALTLLWAAPAAGRLARRPSQRRSAEANDRDERMIVNTAVAMLQLALTSRPPGGVDHDEVVQLGLRALLTDEVGTGRALLERSFADGGRLDAGAHQWQLVCSGRALATRGEPALSVRDVVAGVWVTLVATPLNEDPDDTLRRLARVNSNGPVESAARRAPVVAVDLPAFGPAQIHGLSASFAAALWRYRQLPDAAGVIERLDAGQTAVLRALSTDADAAAVLRRVATMADPALAATFTVWCDCMYEWQAAADRLGVHRNTVVRRVRTLGAALGCDLEHDADACRVTWLALAVQAELSGPASAEPRT